MDKINNINGIVNILRDRGENRSVGNAKKKDSAKTENGVKANRKEAVNPNVLIDTIQSRIKKSNKNATNYREVVMTILAESIIANEFGQNIVNDPNFYNLVNNVVDGYKSEASILKKIDDFISKIN